MGSGCRILLVGCGRICRKHVDALLSLKDAGMQLEFAGVLDVIHERALLYSNLLGCPAFTCIDSSLQEGPFHTVIVMTPSGTHASVALQFVGHTENLIIEKPLALSLRDCDELIDACLRASTHLFVVKQNRFNPSVKYVKYRLDRGHFGDVSLATVRVRWCRPQAYYDSAAWRGTWRYDGGVLANQASHHIDLLQWMFGDVEYVSAMAGKKIVDIEAEDTAGVLIKFSSGVLGIVEATTSARPSDLEGSLSILGSKGLVVVGGKAVNTLERDTLQPVDYQADTSSSVNADDVYGYGHIQFYKSFFGSVLDRAQLVDGIEGRKSLQVIQAIYESIESRSFVDVSFRPKYSKLGL